MKVLMNNEFIAEKVANNAGLKPESPDFGTTL